MKKTASLLMVVLMAFTFMPWSVFAEESEAVTEEPEPAIEEPDVPYDGVKARASESDIIDSGTCGDNLTWTLDSEGLLTISGSGPMKNYYEGTSPWYSQRSMINNIVIGNGVTSIGKYAFFICSNLTEITIPDSVTSIGNDAFNGCRSLTSVTIPEDVTSIEYFTFCGCNNLTGIIIPDNVTSIGDNAFELCSSLTSIIIPDNVTSIGYNAFADCSNLTSITIPDSVTSIGYNAFSGCGSLTSITIPDRVTSIDTGTFEGCSNLTSITIPESVTSIGYRAFYNCSRLKEIYILGNKTTFGSSAFSGIDENYTVYTYAGSDASTYFPAEHIVYIGGIIATGTCGENLTWTLDSDGLLTISGNGPMNNYYEGTSPWISQRSTINNIVIENGVTSIGDYAFYNVPYNSDNVTSVTIPDSVTSIGDHAFVHCNGLTSISVPDSMKSIGKYAFQDCRRLTSFTIPGDLTIISDGMFSECEKMSSIIIPENITSIGDYAFNSCYSLTSITIPDSVTNLGGWVFASDISLTSITLPSGIKTIGYELFEDCDSLKSIVIPEGVTSIYRNAFTSSGLESITIPKSMTSIDNTAFLSCRSLKYVFYGGTEEQWAAFNVYYIENAVVHYETSKHYYGELIPEQAATCTVLGMAAHYECSVCHALFVREGNECIEKLASELKIPALGHNWDTENITWTWAEDYSSATATFTCKNDTTHVETADAVVTSEVVPGTDDEPVGTVYTATVTFGEETYTDVKEEIIAPSPEFTTHSLVLSGRIGVNFFMDLSELSEDEINDSYMEFTVNGETKRVDFDSDNMNPARTYYGFTCYVNSIQMAETIYAVFHYGNGRTVSDTFSIDRYVALFEQNKDKVGADMVAVVESMADYGHYVQPFLAASNGWVIGDKYVEMATHFTDGYDYEEVKSAVAGYGIIKDYEDPDIERINYQLSLDSETEVYVLFKPAAGYTGDISFTVTDARGDTRETEPKMEGDGRYRIEISGISAHLLGTTCTVVAETENGSATVKVSAMSYVKTMLDNYTDTRYLDAAASLYKYFEAADTYKQNH